MRLVNNLQSVTNLVGHMWSTLPIQCWLNTIESVSRITILTTLQGGNVPRKQSTLSIVHGHPVDTVYFYGVMGRQQCNVTTLHLHLQLAVPKLRDHSTTRKEQTILYFCQRYVNRGAGYEDSLLLFLIVARHMERFNFQGWDVLHQPLPWSRGGCCRDVSIK